MNGNSQRKSQENPGEAQLQKFMLAQVELQCVGSSYCKVHQVWIHSEVPSWKAITNVPLQLTMEMSMDPKNFGFNLQKYFQILKLFD